MSVIDFHSHVLPRIDDGSHSSEESLGMLQISASQGIDVMAATSHFYAIEDRISSFLNRRRCSEERLKERMNQELTKEERIPRLIMGVEVAFFTGISRAERLEELTYEGTDLLLLEMPFTKWNKSEIEEVRYILERRKLRVMLSFVSAYRFSSLSIVTIPSLPITSPSGIMVSKTLEWTIMALEEALVNHPLFRISSGSQAPRKYQLPSHQISTQA